MGLQQWSTPRALTRVLALCRHAFVRCWQEIVVELSSNAFMAILPGIWMCALAQISTDRFLNGARRPGDEVKRASLVVKVVMKQLFVALKRLHGMGIVHRDIKPVRCLICLHNRLYKRNIGILSKHQDGPSLNDTSERLHKALFTPVKFRPYHRQLHGPHASRPCCDVSTAACGRTLADPREYFNSFQCDRTTC